MSEKDLIDSSGALDSFDALLKRGGGNRRGRGSQRSIQAKLLVGGVSDGFSVENAQRLALSVQHCFQFDEKGL
jgi:hypothetical protein